MAAAKPSLITHDDGKTRCFWANPKNPRYIKYHDEEWGTPLYDDRKWFELLVLEGAQAGLSWETVLNRRTAYRKAFCNFSPAKVAKLTQRDIARLLKDDGIIRNRLKIESAIRNAKAFLKVQKEFGSFSKYIWQFVNHTPLVNTRKVRSDIPARTKESDAMSKDLSKRGFNFVGSTICYAMMQSAGLVNDHVSGCFKRKA